MSVLVLIGHGFDFDHMFSLSLSFLVMSFLTVKFSCVVWPIFLLVWIFHSIFFIACLFPNPFVLLERTIAFDGIYRAWDVHFFFDINPNSMGGGSFWPCDVKLRRKKRCPCLKYYKLITLIYLNTINITVWYYLSHDKDLKF